MKIDERDKKILAHLVDNARLSYREIAKKVKVSTATVMHRINALTEAGIIKGYKVRINHEKLGYDREILVEVQISKGKLFEVERKIATDPHVFAVYDMTGTFDSAILARFNSRRSLDAFLKKIQTYDFVERTNTRLILNTIKEKTSQF